MDQKSTFCPNAAKNKLNFRISSEKKHFNLRPHGLKKKGKKNPLTPENQASGSQRQSIVTTIVP